ncbi:MAG: proliferating cell nuclear antigen (pcna) [Euryarchaeota archaeon]|nr:proliferating cell nuclear antigen (pcna) [Euryarchaeota archaeon]|tara:strand:+ start:875 stop:1606 length:732 start_codon:yes stop_codon:yes gene_type:complete
MKLTFKSCNTFKKIIDAIKDVCKETNIEINESGLKIKSMDSSHVCLVNLNISSSIEEIICENPAVIALNLDQMSKILRLFDNEAQLIIVHNENKLILTSSYEGKQAQFQILLMDIEMDNLDLPSFDYSTSIKMPSAEYNKLCSNFKEFGDSISFECSNDQVRIEISGDISSGHVVIENSEKNEIMIKNEITQAFSLKYLCLFCKACSCSDFCIIYLGQDMPMKLKFPVGDDDILEFYIAPKLD